MAAPTYANRAPALGTQEVDLDSAISVEITDADGDLSASTVVITPGGVVAWTADAPANGWTGGKTPVANGYRYDLTPPSDYPIGNAITIRLYAEDALSNVLDDSTWYFYPKGKHVLFSRGASTSSFLYSRDGGQTWTTLSTNWDGGPEYGIAMPALDQLWSIVESYSATRVRAGTNLTMVQSTRPFLISFSWPAKMHASAVDNVWLKEGWTGMWQYTGGSRFAASSWTNRPISGVANTPNQNGGSLFVLSPTNVWACSRATNGGFIYNWNGSVWSQPLTARPWNTMWDSCHGSAADNVVFCGGLGSNIHGVVYRWNGSSFDDLSITAHIGNSHVTDVYTTGPDSIWVTVGDSSPQTEDGIWFWNGSVWTRVFAPLRGDGLYPRRWDSITGHDDELLLVAVSDNVAGTDKTGPIAVFDGTTWTEIDSGISHGSSTSKSVRDFYTVIPPPAPPIPPVITPVDLLDGATDVQKDAPIVFDVIDTDGVIDLSETRAWVRGRQVVRAGVGVNSSWVVSRAAVNFGYRFTLQPTPSSYYRNAEEVRARVETADATALTAAQAWSFTARARAFGPSIYEFLISSLRDGDE